MCVYIYISKLECAGGGGGGSKGICSNKSYSAVITKCNPLGAHPYTATVSERGNDLFFKLFLHLMSKCVHVILLDSSCFGTPV